MSIFTHVTLGSNDLVKAERFYDAALGALGVKNLGKMPAGGVMYGEKSLELIILKPRNGEAACHANGGTIGFRAPTRKAVDAFYKAGLDAGGVDEGAPGPRPIAPTAYAAYLRDPDGNKICAYCFAPE